MGRPHADVLIADGITKSYGDLRALSGISLTIASGEIFALLGPNGAGKTTFASLVAGVLHADAGTMTIAGHDVVRAPAESRRILGYVPQEIGVYPSVTVRQNLSFSAGILGVPRSAIPSSVQAVASALRLTHLMGRLAGTLSGGEKRRLHAAMGLLHRPRLLFLDEPTAGVDVDTRNHLLEHVMALRDAGMAICYTTHYLAEVEALDATVGFLDGGRLVATGSIAELTRRHATSAVVARFGGAPPPLAGTSMVVDGTTARYETNEPREVAAALLQRVDCQVEGIEIVRPSLEAVYGKLVGVAEPAADPSAEVAACPS